MSYSFLNEFLLISKKEEGQWGYRSDIISPEASISVLWLQMSPRARNIIFTI